MPRPALIYYWPIGPTALCELKSSQPVSRFELVSQPRSSSPNVPSIITIVSHNIQQRSCKNKCNV